MNTSPVSEPNTEPVPKPAKSRTALVIFLSLVVWLMFIAGGYYVGKLYLDRSIQAVQQNNAVHMITIEQRIDSLDAQISEIKQAIINTDQTLASSGSTQENLNDKIEDLDQQLKDLERSLAILKEAP